MNRAQPRVPAGAPTGGQWAPSQHAETDITLDPAMTLAQVRQAARQAARRYSLDAEELASEALVKIYSARSRRVDNPGAYIRTTVNNTAVTMMTAQRAGAQLSGQEVQAYREYQKTCAQLEQQNKRHLTTVEQDAIAASVRAQYKGHVSKSFHRRQAPLTGIVPEDRPDEYAYDRRSGFKAGLLADHVEQVIENGSGKNPAVRKVTREHVWDALAEGAAAPPVARCSLARKSVIGIRELVNDAGGADQVAALYEAGFLDDDEEITCAFFAPFGDIGAEERAAVVRLLRSYPSYSNELWDAAAGAAAQPR